MKIVDGNLRKPAVRKRAAGWMAVMALMILTVDAIAQVPSAVPSISPDARMEAPAGYAMHQGIDFGGRMIQIVGSHAMYDTLVNLQTGPRVLGESFVMSPLSTNKHARIDTLTAYGSGFGGDPYNFAKLDFSKGGQYEFSGLFRRDRQYFDYDLLGNPNIATGLTIPMGPSGGSSGAFAWPQVEQSPVMFNTVRRMTDTSLSIYPLSRVTYRLAYSQNIFQGPSLTPAMSVGKNNSLLQQFQRSSADDFTGGIDWRPIQNTKITFEEQIDHYKVNIYDTLSPSQMLFQEADGTPVSIGDWNSQTPYGAGSCNSAYTGWNGGAILMPNPNGSQPVINPYCSVATSYLRSQPTRMIFPTEILRFETTRIHNLTMNGDFRYTNANMSLPNYYENFTGLDTVAASKTAPAYFINAMTFTGTASAKRQVIAADYGLVWQFATNFSLAEQLDYSNFHQPGVSDITAGATLIQSSQTAPGYGSINYSGPLTAGPVSTVEGSSNGTPLPDYLGQKLFSNHVTLSWDLSARTTLSLTYRYRYHQIGEGIPNNAPLAVGATNNGTVTIHENGGVFNAALRPANNWRVNGSVEMLYADNVFTPVAPRQLKHYRLHTTYKPKPWATLSGTLNDLERHDNTNNNQAAVAAGDDPYEGPLNHVDYSRSGSVGAVLLPSEHYGFEFNYAYSDVYSATNVCYNNGATSTLPGTASLNSSGQPNVCPGVFARGSTTQLADWYAREFMDAPTQYGFMAITLSPVKPLQGHIGYSINSVNGSQFFNDARAVNGSLASTYQSPYFDLAWTMRSGVVWKAQYNYYGYGEGGASGPEYCSTSTTTTSSVLPCASLPYPTGLTEPSSGLTAPRNAHANSVLLAVHYDF